MDPLAKGSLNKPINDLKENMRFKPITILLGTGIRCSKRYKWKQFLFIQDRWGNFENMTLCSAVKKLLPKKKLLRVCVSDIHNSSTSGLIH